MKDFTLDTYKNFVKRMSIYYELVPLFFYGEKEHKRSVYLRHDVDRNPENSLIMARIEAQYGIKSSFYFRFRFQSWNVDIVKKISDLGHEIGYHYENLSNQAKKLRIRNNELKTIDRTFKKI